MPLIISSCSTFHLARSHCLDPTHQSRPLHIVTASVDEIRFFAELVPNHNLRMHGQVSWVGSSSMEVTVEVDDINDERQG
jgi:acyl-coenzyme A thioesterase 9